MTSPAQLKYLDAMGIPVWVSRDIVIKAEIVLKNSEKVVSNSEPKIETITSSNSAQSIIDSLGRAEASKPVINDLVSEIIKDARLPVEPIIPNKDEPTGKNLVFKTELHYVFANGNENADWMIIGYSPEPFHGIGQEPFAGEAGVLLENMVRSVGIENPRRDAYFVNVFDFNNRDDQSSGDEFNQALNAQLLKMIDKVSPKLVLLVGQNAAQGLLRSEDPLVVLRSKIHYLDEIKLPCVVTYYPSYLLQKPIDKRKAWNDLKLAMSAINDVS